MLIGWSSSGALWRLGAGIIDAGYSSDRVVALGRHLLIAGPDYYDWLDLWTTDGTSSGAFRVQTLPMIEEGRRSFREAPAEFVVANGHVLCAAEAGGDTGEAVGAAARRAGGAVRRELPRPGDAGADPNGGARPRRPAAGIARRCRSRM